MEVELKPKLFIDMIKLIDLLENIESSKPTIEVKKNDQEGIMDVNIYDPTGSKVGNFELESYDDGLTWTITGAEIDEKHRGKGYYRQAVVDLLNRYPNIKIVSAFRSPEANRAWNSLIKKAGSDYAVKSKKIGGEIEHWLSKK
jgi:hypothetical protein